MRNSHEEALARLVKLDARIRSLIETVGDIGPLVPAGGFETLFVSVISQQISDKVKDVIRDRLRENCGAFRKENYKDLAAEDLQAQGLSAQKARTILLLARSGIDFDELKKESPETIKKTLIAFKGIGPWTIRMYRMFAVGEEDILPLDDYGVKEALKTLYDKEEKELKSFKSYFSPHGSLAARYLWRMQEIDTARIESIKKGS